MCNCKSMVRTGEETHGGKYPPSDHAPGCEDFQQVEFSRVEYDGSFCIMKPDDAADMMADGDTEYSVIPVMLTHDQFEKLPEFQGF